MAVKIMRWMPWPPLISKKYDVKLGVHRVEDWVPEGAGGFAVEITWKGPNSKVSLGSFRRTVKRNCTREEEPQTGSVLVEWNEEFHSVCTLSGYKDNVFHPWEITFNLLHTQNQGAKNKFSVIASANLNLAEYASKIDDQDAEFKIPLTVSSNAIEPRPMLCISLRLMELISTQEPAETLQSPIVPLEGVSAEKDEVSALKAGLRKVKIFTDYVSTRRVKKAREESSGGRCSAKNEDAEYAYPLDSESLDETEEAESDEVNEDSAAVRKSCSYGTLAFANYSGVSHHSDLRVDNVDEDWVYYSNRRKSDVGCSHKEDLDALEQQSSRRSILPWRKRKLGFRSPKGKGEPLLKKAYAEDGGDDIDFDRRQLSSDESITVECHRNDEDSGNRSSFSEFGDDGFVVGTWEHKEIVSRDRHMKIQTQVFFASIDQRNERAAGESACTTLVAVIANWLQNNRDLMPVKSQFDSLIRVGSLEWRKLCENEANKERFPDKHLDLETVINAKIWDICVIPEKSFIGFFHPEEGNFDFLNGAMLFDSIWDEISSLRSSTIGESLIFIVSWNDHFFVLKVEPDAYYIIDTLGERLHEGCNQAYILKFDHSTTISKLPPSQCSEETPATEQAAAATVDLPQNSSEEQTKNEEEEEEVVLCQGKEACKEYIKCFLAAIPIRELQTDIKKGLPISKPLHHRLQIEFHFTQLHQRETSPPCTETVVFSPNVVDVST